jgi:predicted RNA-binding Zn-ribbon protein involved in translation (DUF1610 family)
MDIEKVGSVCEQIGNVETKSAAIKFICPGCGQLMSCPAELENQSVVCPACGNKFTPTRPSLAPTQAPPARARLASWMHGHEHFAIWLTSVIVIFVAAIWLLVRHANKQNPNIGILWHRLLELLH